MTAPTMLDPVVGYAAAVRSHLSDLGPEVLDDLTGGLEADLAESLADALDGATPTDGDLASRFGTPEAYAAELRESAGLPPAGAQAPRPSLLDVARAQTSGALARARAHVRAVATALDAVPGWPRVRGFLVALRPLWWVLRGWTFSVVVIAMPYLFVSSTRAYDILVPQTIQAWLAVLACVVVSVELGRGALVLRGRLAAAWRVVAALLVPCTFVVTVVALAELDLVESNQWWPGAGGSVPQSVAAAAFGSDTSGVLVGGQRATNLFVYGPDGSLIDGAQIVDQAGRPVVLGEEDQRPLDDAWYTGVIYVPRLDEAGRQVRHAYPVPMWMWTYGTEATDDEGTPVVPPGETATTPRPPAQMLVPMGGPVNEGMPDVPPSATAPPSDGATPSDDVTKDGDATKPGDATKDGDTAKTGDATKPGDATKTGDATKPDDATSSSK